ncbi:MAG TPA: TldD/PmbA family protein [Acidimicrobiia bacterium]|nr:TldD/PmbA family protein [Acidimicrobiia bacterium]
MFEISSAAVEGALSAGASYADARTVVTRHQRLGAADGRIEAIVEDEKAGVGVRALIGSSWGFYAVNDFGKAREAGENASAIAKASARVPGRLLPLAEIPIVETAFATPVLEDPFGVGIGEKADLLVRVTSEMLDAPGISRTSGKLEFWDTDKWFVSSQGHRIHQNIVESGCGMDALAIGEGESQIRSYPQSFGQYETGGFEVIRKWDLPAHVGRVAEEAASLLGADQCPSGVTDVVLEGSQLALQIHESVGHAVELDRILGWEAAFAGTSFLDLDQLGSLRYGSELMNVTADATIPGALGTFGFDDEGTPAQRVAIVEAGTWVGVLSGRDTASIAGLPPGGMVRADGFSRIPMVRMTNVGLEPGPHSLEEIIADTRHGILMDVNRSWSIDDRRLNFQFGCEVGWEIKNGRLGRMLKNPTYTGITPKFWGSMDRLAGGDQRVHWGTPNCGKGQPLQVGHTGHSAAPARFRDVRVGVLG